MYQNRRVADPPFAQCDCKKKLCEALWNVETPQGVAKPGNPNLSNRHLRKTLRTRCARSEIQQVAPIYTATGLDNLLDGETRRKRCATHEPLQGFRKRDITEIFDNRWAGTQGCSKQTASSSCTTYTVDGLGNIRDRDSLQTRFPRQGIIEGAAITSNTWAPFQHLSSNKAGHG